MILSLGLSPALQRTMVFKQMQLKQVNRVRQVTLSAAGKSLNTARALAALGVECTATGFNGGHSGELVLGFLRTYNVDSALTAMRAETRTCVTLIDESSGTVTELVEEAPQPDAREIASFVQRNVELVKACRMLVISGTLPPWAADDFYRAFTIAAQQAGVPVVIDSHRAALLTVLQDQPLMAKLNLHELELTFNQSVTSEPQLIELMGRLITGGAGSVFLTLGKEGACLLEGASFSKYPAPAILRHCNPIGSGDCATAGIACELAGGGSLQAAARLGVACGSANVESLTPADITRERVLELNNG
ncbi:MAG: hexose kinase [Kiritimatiellae bacterium]|nr:hexose kinase [Kiritimatiellia bacterium]